MKIGEADLLTDRKASVIYYIIPNTW